MTGPAGGWNFWPLVGIPLALVLVFGWLRLPRHLWIAIVATVTGLAWADGVAAWGVVPVAAWTASIAAIATIVRRRRGVSRPPTV